MKPFSFRAFLRKYFFNPEWQCAACGREIFGGGYFCAECENTLPEIRGAICNHCGRKTDFPEEYCDTCKNVLVSIEKGRSAFTYEKPIKGLIAKSKYGGAKYLFDYFADNLAAVYFKNYFAVDFVCYVPMTEKTEAKRGYNHGRLLAEKFSEKTGVPVIHCIKKTKETPRQVGLDRTGRIKNLYGAFSVDNKTAVKDKIALIVDDVTTTGATAEAIAAKLKKAGAKAVYLLTLASVSRAKTNKE